jgi:hypothetical protein
VVYRLERRGLLDSFNARENASTREGETRLATCFIPSKTMMQWLGFKFD